MLKIKIKKNFIKNKNNKTKGILNRKIKHKKRYRRSNYKYVSRSIR